MKNYSQIVFYYHPIFEKHLEGIYHPETPQRLRVMLDYLKGEGIYDRMDVREPQAADIQWIKKIHREEYIKSVERACEKPPSILDIGDTVVTGESYNAALRAAGAVLETVDTVLTEDGKDFAFCAVRPPGHHAEWDRARGFCLFNNIAIGAQYALEKHNLSRIFIFDWDVHHGNGTQHAFEDRDDVFYCSMHQMPLFPGSGYADEKGRGKGEGYTLNIPLSPGTSQDVYLSLFEERVLSSIQDFQPDLIMISCGFDALANDPLAAINLEESGYAFLTEKLTEAAKNTATGKIISVLEGGYNLQRVGSLLSIHLNSFLK
jgi:acetoin utilization deacetylase AcuC-like enzyme